uniref:Pco114428 n=1 Tax=Arundo donax TaxID=35708 RepID=A0A0A9F0V0_ARUDO
MFICDVDVFSTKFNRLIFSTSSIPKADRLVSSCSSNCIRMLWIPAQLIYTICVAFQFNIFNLGMAMGINAPDTCSMIDRS